MPDSAGPQFRLISWNVWKRSVPIVPELVQTITSCYPDIIALQEVTKNNQTPLERELRNAGYPNVITSEEPELLIASRWNLRPSDMLFQIPRPQKDILSTIADTPYGDVELHNIHMPNQSVENRDKVRTCQGIYKALAELPNHHRILCGDFNIPKKEHTDGAVEPFPSSTDPEGRQAELSVIKGLADHDLQDTFRKLHGYHQEAFSWTPSRGNNKFRLDHIFASESLNPIACNYIHYPRENRLSDHSIIYADFKPTTT